MTRILTPLVSAIALFAAAPAFAQDHSMHGMPGMAPPGEVPPAQEKKKDKAAARPRAQTPAPDATSAMDHSQHQASPAPQGDAAGQPQPASPAMPDMPGMGAEAASGPVEAEVVDGVQTVEIEAGRMGYAPREIRLQAGVPTRLVFTRTVEDECSSQVTLPAYGVEATDLPLGEPVAIEFTPTEAGEVEWVCGMDMQRGTIAVVS